MKIMSIGFMVDQDTPMIWRGPMVQSAIYQMLRDVAWGTDDNPLDVLVIDMPPGTGDAQLTIAQKLDVDGAVIVSTPQDLAMLDAIKAIEMFKKTDVKVLGLIENMSTHICSSCGHEEHIFGHDLTGECKKRSVSYLGSIPLERVIRENCDAGRLSDLDAYKDISKNILAAF
jgi:ATP-binding protein involved in chromosome partitioning